MKRRQFVQAAGAGLAAAAVAKPALAQSNPEVKWRLTSSFPKSLDTIYGGAEVVRQAGRRADRRQVPDPGLRGAARSCPALQALDAVQNGTVEACHTVVLLLCRQGSDLRDRAAVPFGLNARQQNAWLYQGGGIELFNEFFKKYNVVGFPCGNTGTQMGGWFRKEIKTAADLSGLKMRIGGIAGQVLQKLGVGAAADRRRRHLSGARERHDRRGRMGRPL